MRSARRLALAADYRTRQRRSPGRGRTRPAPRDASPARERVARTRVTPAPDRERYRSRVARSRLPRTSTGSPPRPGPERKLTSLTSPEDRVLGFVESVGDRDVLTGETSEGQSRPSARPIRGDWRAGKGCELLQRGSTSAWCGPFRMRRWGSRSRDGTPGDRRIRNPRTRHPDAVGAISTDGSDRFRLTGVGL